jgi:hypothetical protein
MQRVFVLSLQLFYCLADVLTMFTLWTYHFVVGLVV